MTEEISRYHWPFWLRKFSLKFLGSRHSSSTAMSALDLKRRRISGNRRPPFRLQVTTLGGEVIVVDADPLWQLDDVVGALPQRDLRKVRFFAGVKELCGQNTLADIEAVDGAVLSAVLCTELKALTASDGRSANIWCAASGRCLRTFRGHRDIVLSAMFFVTF